MSGDGFSEEWARDGRSNIRLRRFHAGAEAYDVAISLPAGPAPASGFPLLLLSDGAMHFDAAAAAAAALARRPAKTGVREMIVAGIASGAGWSHDAERRDRDLVPGGAGHAALLDLVTTRILPEIAALSPVDPAARTVMGHSLGGLFALGTLAASDLFGTCVAFSPSLWRMPSLPAIVARDTAGRATRVLIVSGEAEDRINLHLPDAVSTLENGGVDVTRHILSEEDHGSTPFAALPRALRFAHRHVAG